MEIFGVTEIAPGVFQIRATVMIDGKRHERTKRMECTQRDAVAERVRMQDAIRAEQTRRAIEGSSKSTLSEYTERFIKVKEESGLIRAQNAYKMRCYSRFFDKDLGPIALDDITPTQIETWMLSLNALRRPNGKPYARETLESVWSTLSQVFTDAERRTRLWNPTKAVAFSVKDAREPSRKTTLSSAEVRAIMQESHKERLDFCCMILLAATTGMRYGEITALHWSDFVWDEYYIAITKSQSNNVLGKTKTRACRRAALQPEVVKQLRLWEEQKKGDIVFPTPSGGYASGNLLNSPIEKCCERVGIWKHVTAHTFRRALNDAMRKTAGELNTRLAIGHVSAAMTEHYATIDMEEMAANVRKALAMN